MERIKEYNFLFLIMNEWLQYFYLRVNDDKSPCRQSIFKLHGYNSKYGITTH